MSTGHAQCGVHDLGRTSNLTAMNEAWPVLIGVTGTLLGGLLGYLYSMHAQQLQWRREDLRRREQREHAPKVDFRVDLRFVGPHQDAWITEVLAFIDNKGLVKYETQSLDFELRALLESDPLAIGDESIGFQTYIPHVLVTGTWLPATWSNTFIEPGIATKYSYVTSVPRNATIVLLHARVEYVSDVEVAHTAEALVAVPRFPDLSRIGRL
jgi:hypothetical protein